MVHPGGRPREVSLPPEEMIELGKEMIDWVKLNKPLHISEFYSLEKELLYSEWETMIKRPEFVRYYERAMQLIGKQYLDKNSNVREGASQRWQRVYFKDLKREEDEKEDRKLEKEFEFKKKLLELEAMVKSKQNENVSEDIQQRFQELIDQFSKSNLNTLDNNISNDK